MRRSKAKPKTAFVPRIVFRTALAGAAVVPLCVVACGSENGGRGDSGLVGVAAMLGDSGDAKATRDATAVDGPFVVAVAVVGFGDASDGSSVIDGAAVPETGARDGRVLGVAVIGFSDGGDGADVGDASSDGAARVPPGVAVKAFWTED